MMRKERYPILEYDDARTARIEPPEAPENRLPTDRLVITFFWEVVEKLLAEGRIALEREIDDENRTKLYRFLDADVLLTPGFVGCPACAGNLDMFIGMGIRRVMFCGGGGVLDRDIEVGRLLLVERAIRDEGFSYHYLEPSRTVETDRQTTDTVAQYLTARGVPYMRGTVWTTDALFRETEERIARRRAEGARIVEMEQAGCIAVARFRGIRYGALIYGGDDVSQAQWDQRAWRSREGIRYDLLMLCREIVGIL